jgi:hypothetical protein
LSECVPPHPTTIIDPIIASASGTVQGGYCPQMT